MTDLVPSDDQYLYDCWLFYKNTRVPRDYIKRCWIWNGPRHVNGYGRISIRGQRWYAHRLSWTLHHREDIPRGQVIRHMCNDPQCVNPHHLKLGTQQQNVMDMHLAGRQGYVRKLNPKQIADIRASHKTQAELAQQYQVSKTTIHRVLKIDRSHKYK
jgi:hypothetical protein